MRLVLVEWIDPWSRSGWVFREELDADFVRELGCSTVGWIIRENEERIMLASSTQTRGEGDQVGEIFLIPRCVIERIIDLKEVGLSVVPGF